VKRLRLGFAFCRDEFFFYINGHYAGWRLEFPNPRKSPTFSFLSPLSLFPKSLKIVRENNLIFFQIQLWALNRLHENSESRNPRRVYKVFDPKSLFPPLSPLLLPHTRGNGKRSGTERSHHAIIILIPYGKSLRNNAGGHASGI